MVKLFCTWFALRHALHGRRFATWAGCLSTGSASNGPKESKGSQRRKPWKCKASCVVLMRWPNKRNEILVSHCIIIAVWQCQWPWAGSTNDWIFPLRTDVLHRTSKMEEFLESQPVAQERGESFYNSMIPPLVDELKVWPQIASFVNRLGPNVIIIQVRSNKSRWKWSKDCMASIYLMAFAPWTCWNKSLHARLERFAKKVRAWAA